MTLSRRSLLAATTLALVPAGVWAQVGKPLSAADQALVDRATEYLQGLTEAKARFIQTDARGGQTQGTLFLSRPGRARFDYDAPSGLLVVADGTNVSVQDSRLKTFERFPLGSTPLSIFLAKTIRFDRTVTVGAVMRTEEGFTIAARDRRRRIPGAIALSFADNPLRLTGWTVTDAQNRATRVRLANLAAVRSDPALYVLKDTRRGSSDMRPRM
ncbi:LolA family protein [Phenylobacterium immobile]|uniref:LolA family protein n=1 Tax=Phenylobacterium immobile TaxID=21 RepID=UPI000A987983|nr:outer membrane lipoprotein carrier protein LolA [Phenylobacterium immobile]